MSVGVSAYLSVCLSLGVSAYLSVCLSVCMSLGLSALLSAGLLLVKNLRGVLHEPTAEQILNQSSAARILQELPRYNWLEQKILQRNSYPTTGRPSSATSSSSSPSSTSSSFISTSTATASSFPTSVATSLPPNPSGSLDSYLNSSSLKSSSSSVLVSTTLAQAVYSFASHSQSYSVSKQSKPEFATTNTGSISNTFDSTSSSNFIQDINSHIFSKNHARTLTANVPASSFDGLLFSHHTKEYKSDTWAHSGTDHHPTISPSDSRGGWNSIGPPGGPAGNALASQHPPSPHSSQRRTQRSSLSQHLSSLDHVILSNSSRDSYGYGGGTFVTNMSAMVSVPGVTTTPEAVVVTTNNTQKSNNSSSECPGVQASSPQRSVTQSHVTEPGHQLAQADIDAAVSEVPASPVHTWPLRSIPRCYFVTEGSKFKGRPLTTLPVVLNRDLSRIINSNLQLKSSHDLEHLRSIAQQRDEWTKLTARIREAAEASQSEH
ncbi:hypothetical protein ElyMa_003472500 [Elysia marginata]|uniref:Uncharacterized protein n=1 Tax=Elysia marginata TaxID=1093978 RepID=A0AAV4EBI4_9GAST|nr:hypothetical protein ElyMa_003472500 [Elysia marginata]